MVTLINIILYLNSQTLPQVNVITNFQNFKDCELKFNQTLNRIKGQNKRGLIKYNEDNKKYLEITDIEKQLKSYWLCNEVIFYKKSR